MFGHFENAECTRPTWLRPGVWERNQLVRNTTFDNILFVISPISSFPLEAVSHARSGMKINSDHPKFCS